MLQLLTSHTQVTLIQSFLNLIVFTDDPLATDTNTVACLQLTLRQVVS